MAWRVSPAVSWMLSLSINFWRCFSTVFVLMPSSAPTCLFAAPSATSCSTSASRAVSELRGLPAGGTAFAQPPLRVAQAFCNRRTEIRMAGDDLPDRVDQRLPGILFYQIAGGTDCGHVRHILVVAVRGEHQHLGVGRRGQNLSRRFKPIEQGHGNVHHDHGRTECPGQLHGLAAGHRLADDLEFSVQLQQRPQSLADDGMILGQQYGDSFHGFDPGWLGLPTASHRFAGWIWVSPVMTVSFHATPLMGRDFSRGWQKRSGASVYDQLAPGASPGERLFMG